MVRINVSRCKAQTEAETLNKTSYNVCKCSLKYRSAGARLFCGTLSHKGTDIFQKAQLKEESAKLSVKKDFTDKNVPLF